MVGKMKNHGPRVYVENCFACPHWIYPLGELDEPGCVRYKTVCSTAVERCDLIRPKTISKGREQAVESKKPVNRGLKRNPSGVAATWPGGNRGWGANNQKIDMVRRW
jgi:hypothetical protein